MKLQELNEKELIEISGGESGWYYLGKFIAYLNEAGKGNRMHSAG